MKSYMQQVATYDMKPLLKLTKKLYCSLLQHFAIILETPHLRGVLHTKKAQLRNKFLFILLVQLAEIHCNMMYSWLTSTCNSRERERE